MRKITLLLFALLFSFVGYSQFPTPGTEGFENTTGLDLALPASTSPWTLGTGAVGNQWAVFDNGVVGSPQRRWDRATSNFYAGTQAAFINRKQNGAAGVISEDYLVTPKVTVPANGQLTFYTRTGFNSADDVNYLIKINTITTAGSQTTLANYTNTVQTWNNANPLVTTFNIYELKTVDLSAYANQQVYIAFVRVFNQPTAALGGNSWYVDDVKLVQQCLAPTNQTATAITQTTANLSWTNPSGSTSWEIEVIPVTGTPTGTGTIYNGALPYVATGLTPATGYAYFVRSRCTDSNSVWVGPFNFTTVTPGLTCAGASIIPPTLPYNTNDTTANYSDTLDTAQPAACAGTATNYMTGNDVFYSYTPTTTGAISITMTPGGTNSGIFVYQGCANVGVTCLAGVANTGTGVRSIPALNVTAGQTYIIVLSSISTTQTYSYNLLIQQLNCIPPSTLGVNTITPTGATLTWVNPTSTSWEYVVQTAGSPLPTAAGTPTSSSTLTTPTGLNPDTAYQYWVRSDCGDGTFSPWSGPFPFTTAVAPPVCGGQFLDAGGQAGNYANNSNITYPICPVTAGDQVTVTFTAFNTQAGIDLLKVYDGNGILGTLLATYSGTTIPAPITSSSPDGCLTFVFTSNASTNASGWVANVTCAPAPGCQKPILLTTPNVLYNSVQLAWTQPANPDTSFPSAWEVVAVPCGSPAPTASTTPVLTATTNPFTVTGLDPLTCYDLYVRAVCSSTSISTWSGPIVATTPIAPPICGGNFVDTGGISAGYANNANYSTPICPTNPGDQVTVTFTAFNTQLNTDLLKVYDGNGITGTLLATYSGTTIPPPITSSSPDGCLTFVFTSNGATTAAGWLANVTCAPAPACQKPILVNAPATTVLYNSVTLNWIQPANPDTSVATAWEVVALPCGSPAPTATTVPVITAPTNPFTVTGLVPLTCYDFYVRAVCSSTSVSAWTGPTTATTPIAPPICGGNFVDPGGIAANYPNNITAATGTTIISPVTPGDQVTVTFTSFNTQLNTDLLQVYDGIGTAGTLLATFSGSTIPQPITSSSPNGSLTFVFTSNASTTASGWMANVTCAPAPICQKPVTLTAPAITVLYNSVTLAWLQPQNPDTSVATAWEVVAVPCGSPAPTASTTPVITATTNPFTVTGLAPLTCYDFYVRAVCSTTSTSSWTGPVSATTPISPPICGGNFVDPGGLTGNYGNNITAATGTTIISPVTPGDQVTVIFTAFNTQLNTDLLLVYDGIGTAGTLLATYSGTTIPQPITSSSPEGSLTFVFTSNANTTASGWLANITCAPAPACQKPIVLTIPSATVSYNSVVLGWTQPANPDTTVPTAWEVIALPCGSPAPTASSTPVLTTTNNPFTVPNLLIATCYDFYVRAVCSSTSSSSWSGPKSVSTSTCSVPTLVTAGITTGTSASVGWTETGIATEWEIIYLPAGSPAPGLGSTGITVTTNPYIITGLTIGTFYDVYVRSHCTASGSSSWSLPASLYVNPPLPECAGVNLNLTTTSPGVIDICPDNNCVNLAATYTDSHDTTSYNVFSTAYSPAFPFTGGTQVSVNTDDVWSGNIAIPFKFCFYGNVYNSLNIGSNGVVSFDTFAAGANCPWAFTAQIPSTTFPIRNAIYAPYQDINPNVTTAPAVPNINYQILGVAPCRVMVINFSKVAQFSCGVAVGIQTSQVVLYETSNVIDIYIKDRTSCTTWNSGSGVIGIQNGAGTNAVVPPGRNTGTWSAQNEAWRFLPSGASNVTFQWLQDGAPLTPNLSTTVCVTQDTNLTAQATYTACDGTQVIKSETILLNLITPVTPAFTQIQPLCQGVTAPVLPSMSNNTPVAITGVWSPATIDTSVPGTVTYTFTPTAGQCANVTTMDVTVNNGIVPSFITPAPICVGETAPILPTFSTNTPTAITGVWTPAIVSNTTSGTYTFTPDAGQCAIPVELNVTVNNNCTLGSYASAVWLTNCSTSNFFNTAGSTTDVIGPIANTFTNTNFGTYVQNSNTFILRGAAMKTFKAAAGNVCSTRLNYRIYPVATTPGTFQIMDLPFLEDCTSGSFPSGGTCNPGDQKWQRIVANGTTTPYAPVDLTAYAPGTYELQVYYDISGSTSSLTGCNENVLIDNNGAYFTATFTIQSAPTYTSTNPNTCIGTTGSITISSMTPNTSYEVSYSFGSSAVGPLNLTSNSSGQIIINGLNAGTYSNFALTFNSCTYSNVTPIVLIDSTIPTVSVNSPTVCIGQTATITATPGTLGSYSYTWTVPTGATNPGNVATFNPTISGSYCVVITNTTTGCSSSCIAGTVTINPLPTVTVNSPTACIGQNATMNAIPGATGTYTYTWTVPSGTNPGNVASFNATVSGNYSVTITNALGCTSTVANSAVTLIPIPVVTVSDATICQGTIATVTATPAASGNYSYSWTVPSGTNPGNVASFTTSIAGVYSVVITNTTTGCLSLSDSGTVSFVPPFDFILNGECLNGNFILEVLPSSSSFDLNTASYNWTLNSITVGTNATFDASAYFHDPAVTSQLPVTFDVNVTTTDGCQLSHSILVNRIYCDIQKGISPNNDTKNEFFDLRLMNVDQLEIFNRYGTKVYSKSDYTNQWIGQSDAGNELPDGTYFYVIQFKNNQPSTTGWIYINRDSK